MISAPLPANEQERLKFLNDLKILDTLGEEAYDDLTKIASVICQTPIALVSLVDQHRQWFKSHHGLDASETPRDVAFCSHAILSDELFIIENSDEDERFADNALVTGPPYVKFYAGAPIILMDGIRVGTLCVIDQKPRTLSEEQKASLKALSRQVVALLQLRTKLAELTQLDKAKDAFLSMVSHELRTPLTSIKGSLGIVQHMEKSLSEQADNMIDIASRNTDQLLTLVNDILDLSTITSGKLQLVIDTIDIISLLKEVLIQTELYVDQCQCQTQLILPDGIEQLLIQGDYKRLIQVVTNLISNASKFSEQQSDITIRLALNHDKIIVSVTNSGPGIPEGQQHKIFNKFHQAQTANTKLPGTGLGLAICKHIIEEHLGHIDFHSTPNETTTFFFELPYQAP